MEKAQSVRNIEIVGAREHNLKGFDLKIERGAISVITGVSGSGKSTLAFDIVLAEANRRFFYTLSQYTRQFLDLGSRPSVQSITGLSPAISLSQNETQPSKRATVGTLSDINELLGVLYARFATKHCPDHFLPTQSQSIDSVVQSTLVRYEGKTVGILAPIANQKKGSFKQKLRNFAKQGFQRAYIDGEIVSLDPIPDLEKESKHDIKIVIDVVKVSAAKKDRLSRAIENALEHGERFTDLVPLRRDWTVEGEFTQVSDKDGCPECGFSWPKMDSRFFSINSLGRCPECDGLGYFESDDEVPFSEPCLSCGGTGLDSQRKAITYHGKSLSSLQLSTISTSASFILESLEKATNPAEVRVLEELASQFTRLENVGLGYLNLSRRILSLSGGERQRVRLANVLAENLRGVLYVLDEPSQGLSSTEINDLWETLDKLKGQGNTIIIVDHDEDVIRKADWVIDLGPEGGQNGGTLLAKFRPKEASSFTSISKTAAYLMESEAELAEDNPKFESFLQIHQPNLHNLVLKDVAFPLNAISVVSGVSGAGKSSLVMGVIYRNIVSYLKGETEPYHAKKISGMDAIEQLSLITRKPIAKSSVSMPATYLDIFGELRKLYAKLPFSQISGLDARKFSLASEGGRCPDCKGKGYQLLSMRFLADSKLKCESCQGKRYRIDTLMAKYKEKSIADVLDMSIDEALEHFATFKNIVRRLKPASALGLGYLRLGQPSSTLSGGEAQRLKMASALQKSNHEGHLILMDEPTTGLHGEDVKKLFSQLQELRSLGATLIVIEHNEFIMKNSDWLVKIGPGAAQDGGQLVFADMPSKYLN